MPRKQPGPPCSICGKESIAKKLCELHYRRLARHGHLEPTRPVDWGLKEKHPLILPWRWTKRSGLSGRVERWNDFWNFVSDVGERPNPKSLLKRRDPKKPYGPHNWFWSEPVSDVGVGDNRRASRAAYAKAWRAKNPLLAKASSLKKMFGIGMAEYEGMLEKQNGKCAICKQPDQKYNLAVDHCHGTKRIRGLLCSQCNLGLGYFRDKPELLRRAAEYLCSPE